MNETKFNPSLSISSILGSEISRDSENFLLFLKAYYEWLQTTKIILKNKTGTFQRKEIVIGSTSGCSGIVEEVGTDYIVVKVTTKKNFDIFETVEGQTSSAFATVNSIKDNVVRSSGNLLDYKTLDYSIDKYYNFLREELFSSIPIEYFGNKRLIAKKFKDFFQTRGNEESYRFLFKILYNEEIEFYYPGTDILRVSDGKFEKLSIIRVAITDDIFTFLGKTIRGNSSSALANVVDIKIFFIGSIEVAEFTLNLVSGIFQANETIEEISDETLTTTVYGLISGFNIIDGGSGYEVGDLVTISGDGSEAQARVSSVQDSPITAIKINEIGHGYRLGTQATINNSGTGGTGLVVEVSEISNAYSTSGYTVGEITKLRIVNRGTGYLKTPTITLEDTIISSLGMLSDKLITIIDAGDDYGVGNTLIFTGGSGANATGQVASVLETTTYDLLFEDGGRIKAEESYDDIIKNEDWNVIGPITRIELTNFGNGYSINNLPTITVSSTTSTSSANLIATGIQGSGANVEIDVANNAAGIGSIRSIEVSNFGINYTTANANLSLSGDGNANVVPIISGLGVRDGLWINDDGKIDYKIIQDSFFYQDFSYVIRSGLSFSVYKDILLNSIHPAGFQPFGQILLTSFIDLTPDFVTIIDVTRRDIEKLIVLISSLVSGVGISSSPDRETKVVIEKEVDSSLQSMNREMNVEIEKLAIANVEILVKEFNLDIELEANSSQIDSFTITERDISIIDNAGLVDNTTSYVVVPEIVFQPNTQPITELVVNYEQETQVTQSFYRELSSNRISEANLTFNYFQNFPGQTYGDIQIILLQGNTILDFETVSFDDIYAQSTSTVKNIKINGTVSISGNTVIGTNTNFENDFLPGYYFIVENSEKFVINSISNNTFMTINITPTGTYTNSTAYKELV